MEIEGRKVFQIERISTSGLAWGKEVGGPHEGVCLGPLNCSQGDELEAILITDKQATPYMCGICPDTSLWEKSSSNLPSEGITRQNYNDFTDYPQRMVKLFSKEKQSDVRAIISKSALDSYTHLSEVDSTNPNSKSAANTQKNETEQDRTQYPQEEAVDMTKTSSDVEALRESAKRDEAVDVSYKNATRQAPEYTRSNKVKEYVKARAKGYCEGCGQPAPFISKTGDPYLHAHHIKELSNGGKDTIDTVVALCPNCHYRVHHGEDGDEYNERLLRIVQEKESRDNES